MITSMIYMTAIITFVVIRGSQKKWTVIFILYNVGANFGHILIAPIQNAMYSCSCCLWNISHVLCILLLYGVADLENLPIFTSIFEWKSDLNAIWLHIWCRIYYMFVHLIIIRCAHTTDIHVMQAIYIVEYKTTMVLNRIFTHFDLQIILKRSTFIFTLHQNTDCLWHVAFFLHQNIRKHILGVDIRLQY